MKVAAIIAEYNPFHNGHLYQLQAVREACGADRIVVVLSGDYTQRGIPALMDKFHRSRLALENGADLVLELPVYFSCGSAEYFAKGAVTMLDKLGVVDILHFGSEQGSIAALQSCADILLAEPKKYKEQLKKYLKQGDSFPKARSKALAIFFESESPKEQLSLEEINQVCGSPNNILGMEYIKELRKRNSAIYPVTLRRMGSQYEDTHLPDQKLSAPDGTALNTGASANAIRQLLAREHSCQQLRDYIPPNVYRFLEDKSVFMPLFSDDFSSILYYKLMREATLKTLTAFYDMTPQLADIFQKNLHEFQSTLQFIHACKSKDLTYTRISRCLMHILLDMHQSVIEELKSTDSIQYARVLGFSEQGKDIMRKIKSNAAIPLISKPSKALKELSPIAKSSLEADLYAAQVYQGVCAQKYHKPIRNEYTREIIKVNR